MLFSYTYVTKAILLQFQILARLPVFQAVDKLLLFSGPFIMDLFCFFFPDIVKAQSTQLVLFLG